VDRRVRAKSLEGSKYNENSCPAVIERERKVDKELVSKVCRDVRFLDDVIDVCHSGANEKGKYECDCIVLRSPKVHIDGVE